MDDRYAALGLAGLARSSENIWDAHLPAAMLAGYFFAETRGLDPECESALKRQLDLILESRKDLFVPFAENDPMKNFQDPLREAVENSIDTFSELGHNTIFLHFALRVLGRFPEFATEEVVENLSKLIRDFKFGPAGLWIHLEKGHSPKRFWIAERRILTDDKTPAEMATLLFQELCEFDSIYTQMGSKSHIGHLLTQGQSLIELSRMGFGDLCRRGLHSLETRMVMIRDFRGFQAPEGSFYVEATPSRFLPVETSYWNEDFTVSEWDEGHCLKYSYSFYELADLVSDRALVEKATERFRYLIHPHERSKPQ